MKTRIYLMAWLTAYFLASSLNTGPLVVAADVPHLRAGAVVVDVTPVTLPVIVNGGMTSRSLDQIKTRLYARALALADDETTIVLVVVDTCMMPRSLLDEVKAEASKKTGIPVDRMMFSATHTHTAGSCMGGLGTSVDENYTAYLKQKLVETVVLVSGQLQPARIGFAKVKADEFTAVRRWIRRPDRIENDPFGNPTVRANMHAARNLDNVTGESSPEDPDLTLISVQTLSGTPLCVWANFSMHYFGEEAKISADYFGLFAEGLKQKLAPDSEFVAMMSQGCSGDIWRQDYAAKPPQDPKAATIEMFAQGMIEKALTGLSRIEYQSQVDLAMAEERMVLHYRTPNKQLLEWSQKVVEKMGPRDPKTTEEVYAREQIYLHEKQETEIITQAIRIGDIAIATTPCETYAITGLKIKAASPLEKTMVIELANGGDGYIPPPEQHPLGGYNTWAARSAGLEIMAEPKITASCIKLLEEVSAQRRKEPHTSPGQAAQVISELKPVLWYRLDEMHGPQVFDNSGNSHHGFYEPGVTYYLEGPHSAKFCQGDEVNRAAMFAGGRIHTRPKDLGQTWTMSVWVWNGMPADGRDFSGWFFSQGDNHSLSQNSLHLGIGGKQEHSGKLVLESGQRQQILAGKTDIPRWTWTHVTLVKQESDLKLYLDGELELAGKLEQYHPVEFNDLFFGGRSDNQNNWEGRLDEIVLFNRVLTDVEIKRLALK